jgi:tRNA/tmRNA/rRNA uracil-C5-methylase (TrmA/RlmC/RlmD family)
MITEASKLREGCVESCPACPHRRLTRQESLAQKQRFVEKQLFEYLNVIEPIRSAEEASRWNYRKKVCLAAEHNGQTWNIGVRKREQVILIHNCPVHHEQINRNIILLSKVLPSPEKFPLAYFLQSGKQLTLVAKCRELPDLAWMTEQVKNELQFNGVEGFWLHLYPSTGKKVTGKGGWHLLFGHPRSINENGLVYGPQSFQQVLPDLYNDSLKEAHLFLDPNNDSAVIDLYCGIGSSLKKWTKSGADAIGIELGGEALECAAINAPLARLLRGKCSQRIQQLNAFTEEMCTTGKQIGLYVNPPRTGLEKEVIQWITSALKPQRMAYLSCSVGTLQRDLKYLCQNRFRVQRIIPYDFLPQTLHLENLMLIQKI